MRVNLTFGQGLELALALGGLIWIASQAISVLDPKPGSGLLHCYGFEAMALSIAVVGALLFQFRHGKPQLPMLWFCLGTAAAMTVLAAMYFETVAVLSLAPARTAAVMATVRVRGNRDRWLRWLRAGVGARIVLMVVLPAGHATTRRMAGPIPGGL